ncbi:MAG: hypothetical protein AB1445_09845 [Bacillota bacterium]
MRKAGFLGVLMAVLVLAVPASADDASLGRVGEAVQPLFNNQVRMVSEEVRVTVTPGHSRVDATFTFHNTGPAVTVLVGFPEQAPDPDRGHFGDDLLLHDFLAFVDGKEVAVRREPGLVPAVNPRAIDYPAWYTWEVEFHADQTRVLQNTYWVKNLAWSNGVTMAGYILVTGSTWLGPIGHARVTMEFDGVFPHQLMCIQPGDYRFEGDTLVWEWRDLDPLFDIEVFFDARGLLPYVQWEISPGTAVEWEYLWAAGRYSELLEEVAQARASGYPPGQEAVLLLYEGRAREGLQRPDAGAAWERLLELAQKPGDEYHVARLAVGEASYFLARTHHITGS